MTVGVAELVQISIPFVWTGAVLAISFVETPLKFRAPGITVPLGLGIGRLVFRVLNLAEVAMVVILTSAVLVSADVGSWSMPLVGTLLGLWALLICQVVLIRPRLDRRTRRVLAGENQPRSWLHLAYIVLEVTKVVLLLTLGVLLAARVAT